MNILHLLYESEGDYFGVGGVSARAYELYAHLKNSHDITLLCKKYPGAEDRQIRELRHIFVGAESKNLTRTFLSYAYGAAQFVKKNGDEYDIIIEEFSPAIPTFLHLVTKKPLILQVQGYTGSHYFRKYNPVYAVALSIMENLMPRFYHNFICISNETVKRLSLRSGKYVEVIPNGVSAELLNMPQKEGTYILYIGRIEMYGKGLDLLLNAYQKFQEVFPDIRLVIAGDGKDDKIFKSKLLQLRKEVRANIELLGWVSGERKREAIHNALYCIFPSRHEVQPLSVLEVMAHAKAVVVSDIPEFAFIKENGTGISFKTGSAFSLSQSMIDLMTGNERKEMGQRGRHWVKSYTWDIMAERYEDFLCKIVNTKRR